MVRGSKPSKQSQNANPKTSQKNATSHQVKSSPRKNNINNSKNSNNGLHIPAKITTYTVPPPGWPKNLPYLPTSLESPDLTPSQRELIHTSVLPFPSPSHSPTQAHPTTTQNPVQTTTTTPTPTTSYTPTSNPLIQIRTITSPTHPAHLQRGLFAATHLNPGTHITDYTGLIHHCPSTACTGSDYDMAFLPRDASLAIDGAEMGNEARFVNDFHGVREGGPNAVFEEYFVRVKGKSKDKTGGVGEVWQARMGVWVAPASSSRLGSSSSSSSVVGGSRGGKGKEKEKKSGNGNGKRTRGEEGVKQLVPLGIAKGEEICVSYGTGWWRARRGMMEAEGEDQHKYEYEHEDEDQDEHELTCHDNEEAVPENCI